MISRSLLLSLLWPALLCLAAVLGYLFLALLLPQILPEMGSEALIHLSAVVAFYSFAWLAARVLIAALMQKDKRNRKRPKLLGELITAALFVLATVAAVGLLLGQSAGGILASSGLIIAILGFAIRNVLADVLSGIAIGLEAPFRIGDWVEFGEATSGRVVEIGWRTTRILTPNGTHMILPNSQISRQMLTNYSAPRKHYQANLEIVLGHEIPISRCKQILFDAALSVAPTITASTQEPIVRAAAYDAGGVTYAIKYWVPSFADDIDCRDAVLAAVDEAIRKQGLTPGFGRLELVRVKNKSDPID